MREREVIISRKIKKIGMKSCCFERAQTIKKMRYIVLGRIWTFIIYDKEEKRLRVDGQSETEEVIIRTKVW